MLKVSTLTRRLAAISVAHEAKGLQNPVASPLVRQRCGAFAELTERLNIRRSPFFVRTSLSFSGRWVIGPRTSGIELYYSSVLQVASDALSSSRLTSLISSGSGRGSF